MIKPQYGSYYEITLADGTVVIYRFDGYGESMKHLWIDIKTGDIITDLMYTTIDEVPYP